MKKYTQLTLNERHQIECFLQEGYTLISIAKKLNRSVSTIHAEKNRFVESHHPYQADDAQRQSENRRLFSKKPIINKKIWSRVRSLLKKDYSPEQISGTLKFQGISISHESIYQYIWKDKRNKGQLYLYLRRQGKKYQKRSQW